MSSSPQPDAPPAPPVKALVRRWAIHKEWRPSSQKLLAYLEHKGLPIARNRKTGRPTTGKDDIDRLLWNKAKGDALLEKSLIARKLQKGVSELSDKFVGRDGRFHQEITLAPKTNRMSGRAPNLMNRPQGRKGGIEAEVAEAVRSSIIASEGMLLGELDWRAMEAVLLGFFADDPAYIRLARLGLYSYFVAHIPELGLTIPDLSMPDAALGAALTAIKKAHPKPYADMKKTVLARGYGEGVRSIARDLSCSEALAKGYIATYEAAAPKVKAWQEATRRRAHAEGKLTNPFGYQLKFWDVLKRNDDGTASLGSEANEALAFLPQSTGASMMKEVLLDLGPQIQAGEFHILSPIHDALLIEAPEGRINHWMGVVQRSMERAWPQLGGLQIFTEGKVGASWAQAREWKAT